MNLIAPEHAEPSGESPRARLLVVDDDANTCPRYAAVLRSIGYEVATARNGVDGLFHLATEVFDLVLTVTQMPKLDGASLILTMRNSGILIPVILINGPSARTPLSREVAREIFATVSKPIGVIELLSAVTRALKAPPLPLESRRHLGTANCLTA